MTTVLTVLHVIVCIFLVAVVLLQRGKGAEIGAVFGSGASSTVFGSRGAGNFLTKLTTGSAMIFMLTSFWLSYRSTQVQDDRLFQDLPDEPVAEQSVFEEVGTVPAEATEPAADPSAFEEVGEAVVIEEVESAAPEAAAPEAPTPEAAAPAEEDTGLTAPEEPPVKR